MMVELEHNGHLCTRWDTAKGRWYQFFRWLEDHWDDLGFYFSSTSWLKGMPTHPRLMKWYGDGSSYQARLDEMDWAGLRGVAQHVINRLLQEFGDFTVAGGQITWDEEFSEDSKLVKKSYPYDLSLQKMTQGFIKLIKDLKPRIIAVEYPVYMVDEENNVQYAGQVDALWETEQYGITVLDWKTGYLDYPKIWAQLGSYARATVEMGMVPKVDTLLPIGLHDRWIKAPTYELPKKRIWQGKQVEEGYQRFLHAVQMYRDYYGEPEFAPPEPLETEFSIKDLVTPSERTEDEVVTDGDHLEQALPQNRRAEWP